MQPFDLNHAPTRFPCRAAVRRFALLTLACAAGTAVYLNAQAQSATPGADQPVGWISRPVLSNNNLTSNTEVVFRPGFDATTAQGSLIANHINTRGEVQGTSPWPLSDAAYILTAQNYDTGRRIFTVDASGAAVPFRRASLSATQQTLMGADEIEQTKVVNYLRGDQSNDGVGTFRKRRTVLGDIVHASLLQWDHGGGVKRLYVGANDGMLHVFDASNGQEVFAYVPSPVLPNLASYAKTTYSHQYYVDGPLSMAAVRDGTTTKVVLAGALGAGGKGLFALNVSNTAITTEDQAKATLLWEINATQSGFANLGFTYAMPRLGRLKNNTAAVIVGNGYTNSGNKAASLFIVNALTGALIREIPTGVGDATTPNGLSSPTLVDADGDGLVDLAYAGDLLGNLWKFDLNFDSAASFTATKLFTTSPAQAITSTVSVKRHPSGGNMVVFGTGKALTNTDLSNTAVHAVYGIWDGAPTANTLLVSQSLTEVTIAGERWRYGTSVAPNWNATTATATGHRGWKLSLPAGERVLGDAPLIQDDKYLFTGMNPTKPAATGHAAGENWLNEVSYLTGGNFSTSIFDVNKDTSVGPADLASGNVLNSRFVSYGVSSQPVLSDLSALSRTLFNFNPEVTVIAGSLPNTTTTTSTTDLGVSGGHFDIDIYYGNFSSQRHVHEYDDKYNVTGVNFLAASDSNLNLVKAISSLGTQFKVLLANQYLNPAAKVSLGGGSFVNVKDFQGLTTTATVADFVTGLPIYNRAMVGSFVYALPLDAFKSKDWWGDGGVVRAGLIPTQTGCVKSGYNATPGPNGEIYNGALAFQVIKPDTPASALELNYPAGGAKYGWRVKAALRATYLLAEYTSFWHHENGKCYGQSGWVPNAPQDFSAGKGGSTPAAGSSDPKAGSFTVAGGTTGSTGSSGPVTVTGITSTTSGNTVTTVVTYSDGSTLTEKVTTNSNGTESNTTTYRDGTTVTTTVTPDRTIEGENQSRNRTGRFNWRELLAQ
jgi:Tfp pilus tip-associated adhesin PilY1